METKLSYSQTAYFAIPINSFKKYISAEDI